MSSFQAILYLSDGGEGSLSQISLQFNKGQTIGIVGRTGAGEGTSLVKSILTIIPTWAKGHFTINGSRCSLRETIEKNRLHLLRNILFSKVYFRKYFPLVREGLVRWKSWMLSTQAAFMEFGTDVGWSGPLIGEREYPVSGTEATDFLWRAFLRDAWCSSWMILYPCSGCQD